MQTIRIDKGRLNMNKISMDKKYQTRDGREVRVLCVDACNEHFPVAALIKGPDGKERVTQYTENGGYFFRYPNDPLDLIEVSPWDDFQIDEPVMVRNDSDGLWRRRHFAGIFENGNPATWPDGKTSWSSYSVHTEWKECRRPTPEELKTK